MGAWLRWPLLDRSSLSRCFIAVLCQRWFEAAAGRFEGLTADACTDPHRRSGAGADVETAAALAPAAELAAHLLVAPQAALRSAAAVLLLDAISWVNDRRQVLLNRRVHVIAFWQMSQCTVAWRTMCACMSAHVGYALVFLPSALCSRYCFSYGRRSRWLRPTWSAAILEKLVSAAERPASHLAPAFRLLAELCKPRDPFARRLPASSTSPSEAGTETDATPDRAAANAVPSDPNPGSRADAGPAEGTGDTDAPGTENIQLVARLLIQRLLEGSTAADLQVSHLQDL